MTGNAPDGLIVYRRPRSEDAMDAIHEYCVLLTGALGDAGHATRYEHRGLRAALTDGSGAPSWLLLQYNPLSYGRWGIAPGLLYDTIRFRRRWPSRPLVLLVHEPWVAIKDWRSALMSIYQRAQLRALLKIVGEVLVVRETLCKEMGVVGTHVPIGSNITPITVTHAEARARLQVGQRLVVALFGRAHHERALEYAEAAIKALCDERGAHTVYVFVLGRDSPIPAVPPGAQIYAPGALPNDALSMCLLASDLLLLPFDDGVSTRRGTLMAGLAHGIPVLGLRGSNTDRILMRSGEAMVLTPGGDIAAYAHEAVALANDSPRLARVGDSGRKLYESSFDWPVIARMVLDKLAAMAPLESA